MAWIHHLKKVEGNLYLPIEKEDFQEPCSFYAPLDKDGKLFDFYNFSFLSLEDTDRTLLHSIAVKEDTNVYEFKIALSEPLTFQGIVDFKSKPVVCKTQVAYHPDFNLSMVPINFKPKELENLKQKGFLFCGCWDWPNAPLVRPVVDENWKS